MGAAVSEEFEEWRDQLRGGMSEFGDKCKTALCSATTHVDEFAQLHATRSMPNLRREHLPRVPLPTLRRPRWRWPHLHCAGGDRADEHAEALERRVQAAEFLRRLSEGRLRAVYWRKLKVLRMWGPTGDSPRACAFASPASSPSVCARTASVSMLSVVTPFALDDSKTFSPSLKPGMYCGSGSAVGVTIRVGIEVASSSVLHVHILGLSRYTVWDVPYSLSEHPNKSGAYDCKAGPELMEGLTGTVVSGVDMLADPFGSRIALSISVRISWMAPVLVVRTDCTPGSDAWPAEDVLATSPPYGQLMAA
eukprot:TRINITY_DN15168_c1_g1_i1.p1 TRINITY_DN15168_c1_g1~~TRINITY_DN15168_c1_g1_i1.p1  ORF type:complete len:333 (+),score=90.06 TRINITY_DN15168_c1_g1_i1:81-1001(+)